MHKVSDILERREMRALRPKSDAMGWYLVAHAWAVIAGAAVLVAVWPNPFSYLLAVFLIGGRQLGLAILMHDAAHGLLFRSRRLNEFVGQYLCARPVGLDMYEYRDHHMRHHLFTQQEDDPDLALSTPFPITRASLFRKIARDLTGWTFVRLRFAQLVEAWGPKGLGAKARAKQLWEMLGWIVLANLALWAVFYAAGSGFFYLWLWVLPLATSFQLVFRIRNIAEHAMVPDNDDPLLNTRTTHANLIERVFLAPYWVNYHIEHHLFVFVPCFRLEAAHEILREKGLAGRMETKPGYLSVLSTAASARTGTAAA